MSILSTVPWYIKYPILAIALIAYAPQWIGEKYDQRWEAKAAPYRRERDAQFKSMEEKLDRIEKSAFRIEGILMERK